MLLARLSASKITSMSSHYRSLVAVYAIVINDKEEILLLRRHNTGYRDGFYDMPAGHLEENEWLREATARELFEETGLQTTVDDLEFVELLHRVSSSGRTYLDVFFYVKQWTGNATIQEPEKCDDLGWFPLSDLPKLVPHQHQTLSDRIKQIHYREYHDQPEFPAQIEHTIKG